MTATQQQLRHGIRVQGLMARISLSAVRSVTQIPISFSARDLCNVKAVVPNSSKLGVIALVQPKRPLVTGWILPTAPRKYVEILRDE